MFGFCRRKQEPVKASPFDETAEGTWEPGIVQSAVDSQTWEVLMRPGAGQTGGGITWTVQVDVIPFGLRVPNTRIMARREEGRVVAVQPPGPKARAWFRRYVDIPGMSREEVLSSLAECEGHVVLRLVSGETWEGWISEVGRAEILFDHAPSPFYAQATDTNEMAPPPERVSFDDIAAWLDEDRNWHDLRPGPR
jgi:hypothetical protein